MQRDIQKGRTYYPICGSMSDIMY